MKMIHALKLTGVAAIAAVAIAGTSVAAGSGPPITAKGLAVGTTRQAAALRIPAGSQTIVQTVRVAPGGNFGWHLHGAPVAVIVTSGTLTLYDSSYPGCGPRQVGAGQAFFEAKNHVHLVRNEGSAPAKLYVVMLGLTPKAQPTTPATQPAGCSVD